MPHTVFYSLQFKVGGEELIDETMRLIEEFNLESRVFWGSAKSASLAYMDEVYPDMMRFYSIWEL